MRWCRFVLNHEASCLRGGLRADCLRRCLQRGINRWARHDTSKSVPGLESQGCLQRRRCDTEAQTATIRRLLAKHARRTTSWTLRAWSQSARRGPGRADPQKVPRPRFTPVARRGLLELVRLFALPGDHRNTCGQARALRAAPPAAAAVPRIQQMAPRPRAVHATFKCSRAPRAPGAAHRAAIGECAARRRPRRLVRAETQSVAGRAGAAPFS